MPSGAEGERGPHLSGLARLKILHLLDLFPPGCVSSIIDALKVEASLSPEQRTELTRLVQQLRADTSSGRLPSAMLELVCLASCRRRRQDGSETIVLPNSRAETAEALRLAELTLTGTLEVVTVFETLPYPEQSLLFAYSKLSLDPSAVLNPIAIFLALHHARLHTGTDDFPPVHVSDYLALGTNESQEMAHDAARLLAAGTPPAREVAESILSHLAALVPASVHPVQYTLAHHQMYYPGYLYWRADARTREELIRALDIAGRQAHSLKLSHILTALAWIGDDAIRYQFAQWHQTPPTWATQLFVPPEDYALQAGWHLTASGGRRDLGHASSFRLVARDASGNIENPVDVITPHQDHCSWCSRSLVTLFDLDLRDTRLAFLGLGGERLRISMCERCTPYAPVYTEVNLVGGSQWSTLNVRPDFLDVEGEYPSLPQKSLVLGPPEPTPIAGEVQDSSHMGGYPNWVQDVEYPICPRCRLPMLFVGQVVMDDIEPPAEGTTYAFLCPDCLLAATNYQQT